MIRAGTDTNKRNSEEYYAIKQRWNDILLKELLHYFPHLGGEGIIRGTDGKTKQNPSPSPSPSPSLNHNNIMCRTVSTPLTFDFYLRAQKGEVYGLEVRP